MSAEPVSVEERKVDLCRAEANLGYWARRWLIARIKGERRTLRKIEVRLDEAQQECRRASRRLRDTERRLAGAARKER